MDNPGPSHMKTAMCELCGKAFTPGNLKKHMRMHGANRSKKCTYCDREFPTYKAMTGHRKFAHAEQYQLDRDGTSLAQLSLIASVYMTSALMVQGVIESSKRRKGG